jgi:hypothetical protein
MWPNEQIRCEYASIRACPRTLPRPHPRPRPAPRPPSLLILLCIRSYAARAAGRLARFGAARDSPGSYAPVGRRRTGSCTSGEAPKREAAAVGLPFLPPSARCPGQQAAWIWLERSGAGHLPDITSSSSMPGPDVLNAHLPLRRGYAHARLCDPVLPRMAGVRPDQLHLETQETRPGGTLASRASGLVIQWQGERDMA